MNIIALIGNVTAPPTLRHTPTDRAVCTFSVAVARPGEGQADTFTVVTYERQAEICAEYLTAGRRVGVEGRIHHTISGALDPSRSGMEIIASRVQLLGPPRLVSNTEPAGAAALESPRIEVVA